MMTPDPTVRSAVSEEDKDVALQLMFMSGQGRASASTQDDTFSGRADAASSTGATSDADSGSEDDEPATRKQKLDASGSHKKVFGSTESHFAIPSDGPEASSEDADGSDSTENGPIAAQTGKKLKANTLHAAKAHSASSHKTKSSKTVKPKPKKTAPTLVPTSAANTLGYPTWPAGAVEEEQPDLSTKPRCQRCRKSKKGCDRQRPCGRCRDAGIPAEQCISEDEGNGRKGRYGRHMGVPIKKEEMASPAAANLLPPAPIATDTLASPDLAPGFLDKNKKRKRV
jgi:hypothetical protein